MTDTVTIEGTLWWPKFSNEDEYKPGKFTFEIGNLDEENISKINALQPFKGGPHLHEKPEKQEKGMFFQLKQNMVRTDKKTGQQYEWPIAVRDADGEYLSREDASRLANGSKIRIDVKLFENGFGRFLTFVPSSLYVLEPVWFEADINSIPVEAPVPDPTADDLDDDIPFGTAVV